MNSARACSTATATTSRSRRRARCSSTVGRRLVRAADEAIRAAGRAARGETGRLAIGFIAQLSYEWLPTVLRSFRKRYADVEISLVELTPTRQIEELVDRRIDLGIIGLGLAAAARRTGGRRDEPRASGRRAAAGSSDGQPAHPGAEGIGEGEIHLHGARQDAPAFSPWLLALCQRAGFEPEIALETDRSPSALNYVAAGFGVALFPAQIGRLAMPFAAFCAAGQIDA